MEFYIQALLNMERICKEFKEKMVSLPYKDPEAQFITRSGLLCFTPVYQSSLRVIKGVIEMIELFDIEILELYKKNLLEQISVLESPNYVKNEKYFKYSMDRLIEIFSEKNTKKEIQDKLSILSSEEISRLNEAIHCFLEGCNYSAIAMSVSAIEFRLLSLMLVVSRDPKLEKMTLGQLINEYLNNKGRYMKIIPQKYEPLLEHCNTYRVFSVHPKKEKMNKSLATSILHMTFQFLLDQEPSRKVKHIAQSGLAGPRKK
jgi:hypothetical protein